MKSTKHRAARGARPGLEALESRQLLSAAPTVHPDARPIAPAAGGAVEGFTPSQMRHAYGFDAAPGDGAGQTIAIVDAFRDPNIVADLNTFDRQFGLAAPPAFGIVNQYGASARSVQTDSGWSSEIAMDVEWAHAIAPKASLVLIEANSDNYPDLMAGVDSARRLPGVSVVSMSWGGNEFSSQLQYDADFTSLANHPGVTFVAAAGDEGSRHGPDWPASSTNVLSVGGTTLNPGAPASSQTGWRDTNGGISRLEKRPVYQSGAQGNAHRAVPDVAYNANPNTGYAVYSSVMDGGTIGWSVEAGTSAGAPQWAAQIAIADQLRAQAGKGPLDGGTATLPALYQLYHAPGTAGYATYTASFTDITQGRSSRSVAAAVGYDCMTGLGTPKAAGIISALVNASTPPAPAAVAAPHALRASARRSRELASPRREIQAAPSVVPAQRANPAASAVAPVAAPRTADSSGSAPWQAEPGRASSSSAAPLKVDRVTAGPGSTPLLAARVPAALADAAESVSPSIAGGIASLASAVGASTHVASAAAPLLLDLGRTEAMASFADAIAAFAHESAALGTAIATAGPHVRAWAVTFAVLGVDAILVGYWRSARPARRAALKRSPFALLPM